MSVLRVNYMTEFKGDDVVLVTMDRPGVFKLHDAICDEAAGRDLPRTLLREPVTGRGHPVVSCRRWCPSPPTAAAGSAPSRPGAGFRWAVPAVPRVAEAAGG